MQIRLGAGSEQLVAEQKREVLRVHFVVSWMGYDANDRGASSVEQIN